MQTKTQESKKPEPPKKIELNKTSAYKIGKTTIIVDNVFRKEGNGIHEILSRLIRADFEQN